MVELTPRQDQVAQLLVHGMTFAAIARRLGISEVTCKNHVEALHNKFKTRSRDDLEKALQTVTTSAPLPKTDGKLKLNIPAKVLAATLRAAGWTCIPPNGDPL